MKTLNLTILLLTFSLIGYSQCFIEFTYPNSSETIEVNTVDTIKWNTTNVSNIKLEFCELFNNYPGPNEWVEIVNNVNANTGYYLWDTPDTLTTVRLRISDNSDTLIYDLSDGNINFWNPITTPKNLKIISPNGGEILDTATTYFNIAVKGQNVFGIDVEYTLDNGQNWIHIDTLIYNKIPMVNIFYVAWQTFNWDIPNAISNQCKIRILDKTNNSIIDESDNTFTITGNAQKQIEVLYPNDAYIQLPIDSLRTLSWNSTGISNVKIEYANDYSYSNDTINYNWEIIATSTPAITGSYNWQVPSTILTASRIRISDASDTTLYDISDMNFSTYDAVNNPPIPFDLILTSLNGGEILKASSTYYNISYKIEGNYFQSNFELQFSEDNGQNWIEVDNLSNNGYSALFPYAFTYRCLNWEIPNINSNQCKIRVVDVNNNLVIDESDNVFTIDNNPSKELELVTPNTGQFALNSQKDITWNSIGISNIKIEFAENFNTDFNTTNVWHTIVSSVPANLGMYTWTVPDSLMYLVRIRISDVDNPNIYEISDMDISTYDAIANPKDLVIVTPNGGEQLLGGSVYNNITWMYKNVYNNARIEYTVDNGVNWEEIQPYILTMPSIWDHIELNWVNASFISVNWLVPNIGSSQCKVRIIDESNKLIIDESDAVFTIIEDTTLNTSNSIMKFNNISLFPNPTNGIVHIKSIENIDSYSVYNSNGVCVLQKIGINSKLSSIDISTYNNGLYFIKIVKNKDIITKRILKIN